MILGRNTQQWLGLIGAVLGFVQLVIGVLAPDASDEAAIILGGLGILLGALVAFIANSFTTPSADPQLVAGTMVRITDKTGRIIDHQPIKAEVGRKPR